jgi:septum formation topological specificity factor MinE
VVQDRLADFGGKENAAKIQKIKSSSHILKEHLMIIEAYRSDQLDRLKEFRNQMVGSMEVFSKFEKGKVILNKDIKNYHTMLKINVKCLL